jgi:glucosamine-phosphate N-acetyltransferase
MMIRKLILSDYKLKFIELLSHLTNITHISENQFIKQYNTLRSSDLHLVIEKDNKIIGYGSIIIDFKFYRNCKNIGHIEDIVIHPDYRGNGLSKQLINELIKYGKNMNCYKIVLNCDENLTQYYTHLGFVKKDDFLIKTIN